MAEKNILSDAIFKAIIDAWQIPKEEFNLRISEFNQEDYRIPPKCSERYMIIEITVLQGRLEESKKLMLDSVYNSLVNVGIKPLDILILLNEIPKQNLVVL